MALPFFARRGSYIRGDVGIAPYGDKIFRRGRRLRRPGGVVCEFAGRFGEPESCTARDGKPVPYEKDEYPRVGADAHIGPAVWCANLPDVLANPKAVPRGTGDPSPTKGTNILM